MRYMDRLEGVFNDALNLIREKTKTYKDSWKRRGGRGAWFTIVRPWDRLEQIVERHDGDLFAAIQADPTGADGSALACVRDLMNYMALAEAHSRAALGVGSHGRLTEDRAEPAAPAPAQAIAAEDVTVVDGLSPNRYSGWSAGGVVNRRSEERTTPSRLVSVRLGEDEDGHPKIIRTLPETVHTDDYLVMSSADQECYKWWPGDGLYHRQRQPG
jgi:hypothetical protein